MGERQRPMSRIFIRFHQWSVLNLNQEQTQIQLCMFIVVRHAHMYYRWLRRHLTFINNIREVRQGS